VLAGAAQELGPASGRRFGADPFRWRNAMRPERFVARGPQVRRRDTGRTPPPNPITVR